MNSCLYRATVMHHRMKPKEHRFHYTIFMFYIDLDELSSLGKDYTLLSVEKGNVFSFRRKDHIPFAGKDKEVKENVLAFLKEHNISIDSPRIMLLTNLRTMGYQFNPVSFYFCYDADKAMAVVAEVGNTFGEKKAYLLTVQNEKGNFYLRVPKLFYVSPFIDHDAEFEFIIDVPGEKLNIRIDDHQKGERFFISTLTGVQKEMTNARLWAYAFRFPFITLKVIGLIHWNAFRLWMKGIGYHKKEDKKELQKDYWK